MAIFGSGNLDQNNKIAKYRPKHKYVDSIDIHSIEIQSGSQSCIQGRLHVGVGPNAASKLKGLATISQPACQRPNNCEHKCMRSYFLSRTSDGKDTLMLGLSRCTPVPW